MAKGNPLLGQLRGSIGDVVFSRLEGQQVSRARNRQPANPRTDNQQATRVFLKTASMAYSMLMANLGNQTFQGSNVGAENQRRFISRNVALLRENADNADYNFAPSDAISAVANPYIIGEGNLPSANPINVTATGFAIGDSSFSALNSSYAEVCEALGLPYGTQLTFAIVRGNGDGYITQVIRQRIVLAPSTGNMNAPFVNNGEINLPNPANEVNMMRVTQGPGITFTTMARDIIAVGCVPSYFEGNTWRYGFSQLRYIGTGYLPLNAAIASFQAGAKERLFPEDELYTRQAIEAQDLVDYSGSVSSMLLRVYQYNDEDSFTATRRLVATIEANGNAVTVVTTAEDWVANEGLDTIAVEAEFFGSMPRTFNEENLDWIDPEIADETAIIVPLKYNAGKKSYSVTAKLFSNADNTVSIGLNDNNGQQIAIANFTIAGAPVPPEPFVVTSVQRVNAEGYAGAIEVGYTGPLALAPTSQTSGNTTMVRASASPSSVVIGFKVTGGAPQSGVYDILGIRVVFNVVETSGNQSVTGDTEVTWNYQIA